VCSVDGIRFASLVGAFTVEGVRDFLEGVLRGRTRTQPIFTKELLPLAGDTKKCVPPPKPVAPEKAKKAARVRILPTSIILLHSLLSLVDFALGTDSQNQYQ
jgi:hypothetical protein